MANGNRSNVSETNGASEKNSALEGMKQEVARELGVNLKKGYNGDLTARENGYVGGYMVKKMIEDYEREAAQNPKQGK